MSDFEPKIRSYGTSGYESILKKMSAEDNEFLRSSTVARVSYDVEEKPERVCAISPHGQHEYRAYVLPETENSYAIVNFYCIFCLKESK